MRHKDYEIICQIIKNIEIIENNLEYISSDEDFYEDSVYTDSCYFRLAQIGEACNSSYLDNIKEEHPEIEWKNLYGLRNKIDHGYEEVTFDKLIVYEAITEELPDIKQKFLVIKDELQKKYGISPEGCSSFGFQTESKLPTKPNSE